MWDEIETIEQRVDMLLEQALHLTNIANRVGDMANDIAVASDILKHKLKELHRYQDDLK